MRTPALTALTALLAAALFEEAARAQPTAAPVQPQFHEELPATCNARADCDEGSRCLRNLCVSAEKFDDVVPHVESLFYADRPPVGYAGAAIGPVALLWDGFSGGGQLGVRLGTILVGHLQLELDVAPGTTVTANGGGVLGMFEAAGTVGYLARINPIVAWILRVGGGGGFVFGPGARTGGVGDVAPPSVVEFGEVRLDLIGVAIRPSKDLLIELNVPSYRVMFPHRVGMSWVTNVAFNYLF